MDPRAEEKRPGAPARAGRFAVVLWLTVAFWSANVAVFSFVNTLERHPHLLAMIAIRLPLALFGGLLCIGIHFALRRISRRSLWTRAGALALLAPLAAETYSWATYFAFAYVNKWPFDQPINWAAAIPTLAMWTWFFIGWAALCLAFEYYFDAKDEEVRVSELTTMAQTAKLQALRNQINPHFLFNSLNSISALINDKRIAEADQMIVELGDYLRKTLALDPIADTTLAEEMALQAQYLRIEQWRYPDLVVSIDLPADLADAAVPPLLLQPLVENAVKHGVARAAPPTAIALRAKRDGENLAIEVENSGQPSAPDSTAPPGLKIGLTNVRERLAARFGPQHDVVTRNPDPARYAVIVILPLTMRA